MSGNYWLTTERLALRRFTPAYAVLRYGYVDRQLPRIAGIASLGNHASQHVLTKIGLERRGERAFSHPAYAAEGPLAWFEREAKEWLAEYAPAETFQGGVEADDAKE